MFGTDFYVVDAGNRRLVWLKRQGASAIWQGVASVPEGWAPVSCTVDHFGVVYVADKQNHRLVSFNWFLEEIARYGSYGTGATNYNTFAYPHDVHIPFGKKIVNGQTIWYGEGRILMAEQRGARLRRPGALAGRRDPSHLRASIRFCMGPEAPVQNDRHVI